MERCSSTHVAQGAYNRDINTIFNMQREFFCTCSCFVLPCLYDSNYIYMYMHMYFLTDQSLTVARTKPIFVALEKWESEGEFTCGDCILVPASRSDIIRNDCSSYNLQKKKAAEYYVGNFPFASLGHLARCLYRAGEEEAIRAFKEEFTETKGSLLTLFSTSMWVCLDVITVHTNVHVYMRLFVVP